MLAIIKLSGKQYKVKKGDFLEVSKLSGKKGETREINDVLLVAEDKKVKLGTPFVKGSLVKIKIVDQYKGDKVEVRRYKAKVRYRRKVGFRPQLTKIEVLSIN